MPSIHLKPEGGRALLRRHPWIFSGAIARIEGDPAPGETVEVIDSRGHFLARAAYSPHSQIAARVWTFDPDEAIGASFFRSRIEKAVSRRLALIDEGSTDALRLVNAEADGVPGLVVDRYASWIVCQITSTGPERWREEIVSALVELLSPDGIYERSDASVRSKEGLDPRTGVLAGAEPPDLVETSEGALRFLVDVKEGHKTGFYLDQRENRAIAAAHASGAEVLNAFAYTGAFAVAALRAGALRVTNVETSSPALLLAERNAERNGLGPALLRNIEGDVFHVLRRFRDEAASFDMIVLDPPRFAESQGQVPRASRGYKDINLLAFRLLRPGGILVTFSCSGHVSPELFQKIVADAALDARREARIVRRLSQGPDHPVLLAFPEGAYLKGLVCRVD